MRYSGMDFECMVAAKRAALLEVGCLGLSSAQRSGVSGRGLKIRRRFCRLYGASVLWLTKRLRCKERSGSAVSDEEVEVVVAAKILQVGVFEKSIFRG
jgi:hypothetical protein